MVIDPPTSQFQLIFHRCSHKAWRPCLITPTRDWPIDSRWLCHGPIGLLRNQKKTELIIIKFFICFRWPRTRLANSSPIVLSLGRRKKQTPLGRPLLGLTSLATDNYVPCPSSTAKFVRPSTLKRFARAHSQRRGHKKASLCTPATVHTPRTTKWLPALRAFAAASARTSLKSILLYSDLILMARTADRSLNGFFGEACSEIFAGSHDLSAHYQTHRGPRSTSLAQKVGDSLIDDNFGLSLALVLLGWNCKRWVERYLTRKDTRKEKSVLRS